MSRAIVGFMLVERRQMTVSQLCTLFESLLDQGSCFETNSIVMVHGDSDPLYFTAEFQELLRDNEIQFSSTESKPRYNQTIESAINILKTIICHEILNWPLAKTSVLGKQKTALKQKLKKEHRGISFNKAIKFKEIRECIFGDDFFVNFMNNNGMALLEKAVKVFNGRKHPKIKNRSKGEVFGLSHFINYTDPWSYCIARADTEKAHFITQHNRKNLAIVKQQLDIVLHKGVKTRSAQKEIRENLSNVKVESSWDYYSKVDFLTNILIDYVLKSYKIIRKFSNGKGFVFCRINKSEDNTIPLNRSSITKPVNQVLKDFVNFETKNADQESEMQMRLEKKWLSHSFRINYITMVWKNQEDLEFVRQLIGHSNIQTTSSYIHELTDQEKLDKLHIEWEKREPKKKEKKNKKKNKKKIKKIKKKRVDFNFFINYSNRWVWGCLS